MRINQRVYYLTITCCLLFGSLYLGACQSSNSTDATIVAVSSETAESLGKTESTDTRESPESPISPLSTPDSPLFVSAGTPPVATPSETTGSIVGAVIVKPAAEDGSYRPFANLTVAVAGVLEEPGVDTQVAAYKSATAPKAVSDEYGRFAINDMSPGKYALILDLVIHQHLVLDPESGEGVVFEVEAGKTVDLGTFLYDSLPIEGFE